MNIEAYKRINEALVLYLNKLEKLDIELFKKETEEYNNILDIFITAKMNEELLLVQQFSVLLVGLLY